MTTTAIPTCTAEIDTKLQELHALITDWWNGTQSRHTPSTLWALIDQLLELRHEYAELAALAQPTSPP